MNHCLIFNAMKLVRKNKKSEKICKITQIIQYSANFEQNAS
jgi:hypothetical protein